jgi:hypothetical protein
LNNDQMSSGVLFASGLAICFVSILYGLGSLYNPGSGFMPFLTGAVISFFSGIGFIRSTIGRKQGEGWSSVLRGLNWRNPLIILVSLTAYALLLKFLGFFLCTCFFIAFLFKTIAPHRWSVVIGGALLTAIASYVIFEIWLKAQLPKGPLGF